MRKTLFIILFCLISFDILAQNLVPNPSFEQHNTCEFIDGSIDSNYMNPPVVVGWCSGNLSGTPDYFNTCQVYHFFYHNGIPVNNNGYQFPKSGNAYAGLTNQLNFSNTIDFRDYIQTKLKTKLIKGTTYCFGFYTNLANGDTINSSNWGFSVSAIQNWGLLLSAQRPFNPIFATTDSPPNAFALAGEPQIKTTEFIKDTVNWTLVSGIYTATGDEEWITIGNFNPPGQTMQDTIRFGTAPYCLSYYFIDDVFVIPMVDGSLLPSDTAICAGSFPITLSAFSGFTNYLWEDGSTTTSKAINQLGIYAIEAEYEGCQIRDTITIVEKPIPMLDLPTLHVCTTNLPKTFTPSSIDLFDTFIWSDGSTTPSVEVKEEGKYILNASSDCGMASDTLFVVKDSVLEVNIGDDFSICQNSENVTVILSNSGSPLPFYAWSTGEDSQNIATNQPGSYVLSTMNECGVFEDEIMLFGCKPTVYMPNVFSPDAKNGVNRIFKPEIQNAELLSMEIYDRWGGQLFAKTSMEAALGWDGYWKGKICEEGTYVYYLIYKSMEDNKILTLTGSVTLLR